MGDVTDEHSDFLTIINSLMVYAIDLGDRIEAHKQWRDRHPLAEILDPHLIDDYGDDPPPQVNDVLSAERFHQLICAVVLTAQKLI